MSTTAAWLELQQAVARYLLLSPVERDVEARCVLLDRTIEIMSVESRAWAAQRRQVQAPPHPTAATGPAPNPAPHEA